MSFYYRLAGPAVLAGTTLLTAPAMAQTDDATLDPMVITAGRLATPGGYLPEASNMATGRETDFLSNVRTVDQISRQQLEDIGAHSLTEAMAHVPGVTQGNTMGGTEAGFIKRGFGSNSDGSILRDGIRQPRNTFATFTTERIEVLKGPGSFRYGVQEPGGVINLVSKKPLYEAQRLLEVEGSSFGGGRTHLDVTGPLGDTGAAFRFIVGHQDEHYWRDFGVNRQTVVAPSIAWSDDTTRLWLSYEYRDYDQTLDRGTALVDGQIAGIPRTRRLDENWSRVSGHDQSLTARWEQDLDRHWTSRLNWGWNRRQYDDGQPRVLSVDDNGNARRRADANQGFDRRVIYTSAELLGDIHLAGLRHELTLGADHERRRDTLADRYRGATDEISIYSPSYGDLTLEGADYQDSTSNRLDEINTTSAYIDDNIHLGERWLLGLGGRMQHYAQYGGQGRPFVKSTDTSDNIFLPHASLLYHLDADTSLYASVSESFVPNDPDSDTGQRFDPETGRGWETGIRRQLMDDRLAASLAFYHIDKENVVVSDNGVSRAIGESRAKGIELSMTGELTDRLSLQASYAWTDAEVRKDGSGETKGNDLPNVAHHTASLLLAQELALAPEYGRWRVGGGVRYVGQRAGDSDNSFTLEDYTVADVFARWTPRGLDNTDLTLRVNNLFDTTYYPSSGGDTRIVIGDPLEIRLGASVRF